MPPQTFDERVFEPVKPFGT